LGDGEDGCGHHDDAIVEELAEKFVHELRRVAARVPRVRGELDLDPEEHAARGHVRARERGGHALVEHAREVFASATVVRAERVQPAHKAFDTPPTWTKKLQATPSAYTAMAHVVNRLASRTKD
jgi:hypothetical protein